MLICRPISPCRARGVALVIVLAFVVLLTGLVLAFFSRALSERQISNSSANAVRVDLFAQDAVATTLGDLRQEIAAGSVISQPSPAPSPTVYIYKPKAPITAVPYSTGVTGTTLPNLLKRSAYDYPNDRPIPFFSNPTPAPSIAPYDVSNFPPSKRAAKSSSISASLNGRAISPARWNKGLLLPKDKLTSDTDFTPLGATAPSGGTAATWAFAPDWIVVARGGTNPTIWDSKLKINGNDPAVGRYAYNIYDEGGVLDMNAAGYPDVSDLTTSQGKDPMYKPSLAFADLKQLPGISNLPASRQEQVIRTLVGWRNYASSAIDLTGNSPTVRTPISGSVNVSPGYTWAGGSGTSSNELNYLNFLRFSNDGFLYPANRLVVNSQSDRSFASRQQLINLLLNSIADQTTGGAGERAALQNALQYLGTFSRSLNQPSYFPVSRAYDATNNPSPRPAILPSSNLNDLSKGGGNIVGDNYSGADQDALSPSFLMVRAEAALTRNDGTSATAGEPLVKTRFALQRIAWLTCQGPSALRNLPISDPGSTSPDYDMWQLMDTYGIPRTYLLKGTADNVKHYFGLEWDSSSHCWKYDLHNRNGAPAGDVTGATGVIRQLKEIADLKTREPDFFELLKASVDPGALGKASTNSSTADTSPGGGVAPLNVQFYRDISYDAAIIQLGANIIDQFDADGFPTRIVFNDGNKPVREFRGIENLPYVYRVRTGILRARDPAAKNGQPGNAGGRYSSTNGCTPELHSGISPGYTQNPLIDTGVGVLMAIPDLWNPHDQNSSLGLPRPGAKTDSMRVIAISCAPDGIASSDAYNTLSLTSPNAVAVGGSVISLQSMGRYKGKNYQPPGNGGGGAVPPGTTGTGADQIIPIFSRTPTTPSGSGGTAMTGANSGYNNQQVISSLPFTVVGGSSSPANSSTLYFSIPGTALFREPTMLAKPDTASGSGLRMSIVNPDITGLQDNASTSVLLSTGGLKSLIANPLGLPTSVDAKQPYIGIYLGVFPLRWVGTRWANAPQQPGQNPPPSYWVYTVAYPSLQEGPAIGVTYCLQCLDAYDKWVTYDEKYLDPAPDWQWVPGGLMQDPSTAVGTYVDPRTARFGAPTENNIADAPRDAGHYRVPATSANWLDGTTGVLVTERPDLKPGFFTNLRSKYNTNGNPPSTPDWAYFTAPGWHYRNMGNVTTGNGANTCFFQSGMLAQNDPAFADDGYRFATDSTGAGGLDPEFYSDPDGVVRRGMAAYAATATGTLGQPLATASSSYTSGKATVNASQSISRPRILNRPFRSVGELGYVFSGTPWKNLDFSTAESGYSELLDVFCVNETDDASGLVAGKLDLNTRQPKVLAAMIANTLTSEATAAPTLVANDASDLGNLLVKRTSSGPASNSNSPQPLTNIADLVGKWTSKQTITGGSYTPALNTNHNIDGSKSYDGFSADIGTVNSTTLATTNLMLKPVQAQRETAVRALAAVGNTRVWNLMIDLIAQTGRYPTGASGLNNFLVEGEQRCWVHIAIDRYTGQVLDSKLEIVKE